MQERITTLSKTWEEIRSEIGNSYEIYEGPKEVQKQFHIYHCINKEFMFTETEKQPRKYVGSVMARDMEQAFMYAQNDFNEAYKKYGQRSTSVGDIVQDDHGFYMVMNMGFKLICLLDDNLE